MKVFVVAALFIMATISCCSSVPEFIPKINDENGRGIHNNEISIITYNIQTVFGKGEDKIVGLSNYLDKELYDFVLLQEIFDEKTRKHLLQNVNSEFYISKTPRIDYSTFPSNICQDAGLFSISKFPLIDLSHIDFGENTEITNGAIHQMLIKEFSISFDFMANKSILGTLHQINDSTKLFMFTTHLQAISSRRHRTTQLKQIQAFIENAVFTVLKNNLVESPQNLILLLTGDFNYNAYSEDDVESLAKYLGNPRDLYKEFNKDLEEYTLIIKLFGLFRRVDYIFAYDNIGPIAFRKVDIKTINVTEVVDENNESVSDHLALKATLVID